MKIISNKNTQKVDAIEFNTMLMMMPVC